MTQIPATAWIPPGPLLHLDELVHRNINDWSQELLQSFHEAEEADGDYSSDACTYLNQTALLASLQGKLPEANTLCNIQIKWLLQKYALEDMEPVDFIRMFQPWINQGRLHYVQRHYGKAISHFNMIERVRNEKPIELEHAHIDYQLVKQFISDDEYGAELTDFLYINYIDGLLKIYIKTMKFQEGLAFIRRQKVYSPERFMDLLVECEILMMEYMGRCDMALRMLSSYRPKSVMSKLFFLYHRAINYFIGGDRGLAQNSAERLAGYLLKVVKDHNFVEFKKLVLRTAGLCLNLGLPTAAHQLYLLGYEWSLTLKDQRYKILFGLGLSKSPESQEQESRDWAEAVLDEIAVSSYKLPLGPPYKDIKKRPGYDASFQELNQYILERFVS